MEIEKRRVCTKCHQYLTHQKIEVPIVWVIGGPGCGKGTQCEKIAMKYRFQYISTGTIVAREIENHSRRSKILLHYVESGKLVPNETMIEQLKTEMYKHVHLAKGYAVDGYPCNKEQGILFEENIAPVDVIFFLDAPAEVHFQRIINRGKTSGRVDDNEETVKIRFDIFASYKDELLKHFKEKLVIIDGNRHPEEVFQDIIPHMDQLIGNV